MNKWSIFEGPDGYVKEFLLSIFGLKTKLDTHLSVYKGQVH